MPDYSLNWTVRSRFIQGWQGVSDAVSPPSDAVSPFISSSHQTGLDTRPMTWRVIIVEGKGKGKPSTSRGLSPAGLCLSSAQLVQWGPDEPTWKWTQIWVQAHMPDYSLNMTAGSRVIQYWQMCLWWNSTTQWWPGRGRRPFGLISSMEHWPYGTDGKQSDEKPLFKAATDRAAFVDRSTNQTSVTQSNFLVGPGAGRGRRLQKCVGPRRHSLKGASR